MIQTWEKYGNVQWRYTIIPYLLRIMIIYAWHDLGFAYDAFGKSKAYYLKWWFDGDEPHGTIRKK